GFNSRGQVGDGSEARRRDEPRPLDLVGVREIAAGHDHSCARTEARLYCWGSNDRGQLGLENVHRANHPIEVAW
ncbi:MAG TPA: hypothetical protein RMH99_24265, partial [Sandaracinaceae bacterium LLY-WYZ-13_1]|nr:hypothetical protein [Sandaracinaceae bacterium LLY-WYZ-13_1]